MMNKRLILGIQKDGRLAKDSFDLLSKAGLEFEESKNHIIKCKNFPLDIIKIRQADIPLYVELGAATMGIVGKNVIYETTHDVKTLMELNFGFCSLQVAVLKNSNIKSIQDLKNLTVATSYPNSVKQYFEKSNIPVKITKLNGSVEMAPSLGIADAVVDLVSTGKTLSLYDLLPIDTVYTSHAVLIVGKKENSNLEK